MGFGVLHKLWTLQIQKRMKSSQALQRISTSSFLVPPETTVSNFTITAMEIRHPWRWPSTSVVTSLVWSCSMTVQRYYHKANAQEALPTFNSSAPHRRLQ